MKCEASRECDQPVEVNLTWSVHLADGINRSGGNFCGSCASAVWEKVSQSEFCLATARCEEPMRVEQEQVEDTELRETKVPFLRVATGGKGPPKDDGPADNWLERLAIRSVFCCRANQSTVDWELYFLAHKFTNIYLLKMETPDGKVWERRVCPKMFCKHYRDYELIAVEPEPTIEAPEGDEHGRHDPDSDRSD